MSVLKKVKSVRENWDQKRLLRPSLVAISSLKEIFLLTEKIKDASLS